MGTERSAAEEKCLRDLFDRLDFDFHERRTKTKQRKGGRKETEKEKSHRRCTTNPRLNEKLQNSETVNIARSLAVQPDSEVFFHCSVGFSTKSDKARRNFSKIAVINAIRISEARARAAACVRVCSRETWTKSKREERVKREFNTQNLKIIGFRCADCNPHKSRLVSGLQSKPNIWRRNKWKRKTRLTVGLARKIN